MHGPDAYNGNHLNSQAFWPMAKDNDGKVLEYKQAACTMWEPLEFPNSSLPGQRPVVLEFKWFPHRASSLFIF